MAAPSARPPGDIRSDETFGDLSLAQQYLSVARRLAVPIVLSVALLTLVTVLVSFAQQHLYRSSAQVLLRYDNFASALAAPGPLTITQDPRRLGDTQAEVAATPAVARRALSSLRARNLTPDDFLAASSVTADPNADLLTFSVDAPRPDQAVALATAYARAYTGFAADLDTRAVRAARETVARSISDLEAAGDATSPLHDDLVRKQNQLRTIEALQAPHAFVVRSGSTATQVQPKTVRNGVLGFALGLVLAVGLVVVSQAFDTRLHEPNEIADVLAVPLLGRLPRRSLRSRAQRLGVASDPFGNEAELARLLKTRVEFAVAAAGARTIMVTGDGGHERNAPAVAQLALALARSGRPVAVVDVDVRAPTVHAVFDCARQPGLSEVLDGRVALEEAIVPRRFDARQYARVPVRDFSGREANSPRGGVKVLPAGARPEGGPELVGTPAFTALLERLREVADIVLFQAPPLLQANEALALTRKVDAILLVVHAGASRRTKLAELARALDSAPATALGFVLVAPGPATRSIQRRPRPGDGRGSPLQRLNGRGSGSDGAPHPMAR